MQIHIHAGGQQQGPFSLEQVNQKIQSGELSPDATKAWYEGAPGWMSLAQVPGVTRPAGGGVPPAMPSAPPPVPPKNEGDATGGIIPYKNPKALTAYYLGIFGLFPVLGFFLAIPAVWLGILGLRARKDNPVIKGSVHAWIGIVLGVLSIGYNGLFLLVILLGIFARR